jgi:hypothetical protein
MIYSTYFELFNVLKKKTSFKTHQSHGFCNKSNYFKAFNSIYDLLNSFYDLLNLFYDHFMRNDAFLFAKSNLLHLLNLFYELLNTLQMKFI